MATEAIINAYTPKDKPQSGKSVGIEKGAIGINKGYLHRFRRRPAIREDIDHISFKMKGTVMALSTWAFSSVQYSSWKVSLFAQSLAVKCNEVSICLRELHLCAVRRISLNSSTSFHSQTE